jgi:hypothetical protein
MLGIMGPQVTILQGPIVTGAERTFRAMNSTTNHSGFASRLAELCADLGIPAGHGQQAALGRMFNVTPKAARKWLVGDGYPEMETALKICDRAGVNINWLLQGVGPKRGDKVETKALVLSEAIESLPIDERQQALNFLGYTLEHSSSVVFTKERLTRYMRMLDAFKQAPKRSAEP